MDQGYLFTVEEKQRVTEQEILDIVKAIKVIVKKYPEYISLKECKKNDKSNFDFIPINAGNENQRFRFYSQLDEDGGLLMAEKIAGIKKTPREELENRYKVRLDGKMGINNVVITEQAHLDIVKEIIEKMKEIAPNKFWIMALD